MPRFLLYAIALASMATSACGHDAMMSPNGGPELMAIEPAAAAMRVSPSTSVRLMFSQPMMIGAQLLVRLHTDSVNGPEVAGIAMWSSDRTVLVFTPASALLSNTTYVVHLAGEMRGMDGTPLNHRGCDGRGGRSVSEGMMGGDGGRMLGNGWRSTNGTYGRIFSFTTAE